MTTPEQRNNAKRYREKHREALKEKFRVWYLKNRDREAARSKKYREENREEWLKRSRERYHRDIENRRVKNRLRYSQDPEKAKAATLRWRKENPEKARESDRKTALKKLYGLSVEGYNALLERQDTKCGVCRKPLESPCVDHCHKTGKVRGILCPKCNQGLGQFDDSPSCLIAAAAYLEKT